MIVDIGDKRVEADAAEEFLGVLLGVLDNPVQRSTRIT
jgi:hypothetical protein